MRDFIHTISPLYIFLFCLSIGFGILSALLIPTAHAVGHGERLIIIHDRDSEQGLISKDDTLRQVFAHANIRLDKNDRVEPGLDEPLITNHYQVNIYRARPVVIVDGPVKQLVMSAYQTPKQIAKHAGIELRDEDKADVDFSNNLVSDGASIRMNIDRATPVNLTLYGKSETVYTQADTVAEFLKEKNITLGKDDDLSVDPGTRLVSSLTLSIWRNGKQTMTQEEDVAFDTETIQDANRDVGYKQVDTPGITGKKMVTYEIVMQNGVEVSRTAIQSVVTKQPTKQVETVGAKVASLPGGSHTDWMSAAGMSAGDYGFIDYIFTNESHWNPAAANSSGYYGLGQTSLKNISSACPNWQTDPVCQIRWFNGYATSRYGSWSAAYQFKKSHGWW